LLRKQHASTNLGGTTPETTMKTYLVALAALAAVIIPTTSALAIGPKPGPDYVQAEMTANHSDDTGQIVEGCLGFNHVVYFGNTPVCIPASQVGSEQTYDPDSGRWVLP
jgi:hypothetical protein